jgi:hypothetical protein
MTTQGRDQRKQLQEERGDQHLAQVLAIFMDRAEKPGDVEAPGEVDQAGPLGHQHQLAVPDRFELGPGHEFGARLVRRLHNRLVVAGLAEQQVTAIAQHRDRGLRGSREALPVAAAHLGLETQFLGVAQHFRHADGGHAHAVAHLLGIGADALEAQQRDQDSQARIRGTGVLLSGHSQIRVRCSNRCCCAIAIPAIETTAHGGTRALPGIGLPRTPRAVHT